jgi:hypothetical protein
VRSVFVLEMVRFCFNSASMIKPGKSNGVDLMSKACRLSPKSAPSLYPSTEKIPESLASLLG